MRAVAKPNEMALERTAILLEVMRGRHTCLWRPWLLAEPLVLAAGAGMRDIIEQSKASVRKSTSWVMDCCLLFDLSLSLPMGGRGAAGSTSAIPTQV